MHAIVKLPNGTSYISAVFGYYQNIISKDIYKQYDERVHNPFYIVWDPTHTKLVKWLENVPNTKYIIPQILIVDADISDWITNDEGEGCVNFLTKEQLEIMIYDGIQPEAVLRKCRDLYADYHYEEINEIRNQQDIDNLMAAAGYFHDARIAEEHIEEDGTLHLHFVGTWGCEVDLWFSGDLDYDTTSRDPEETDPYWYDSSIILQDGFVYFVDEENMTVEKIDHSYCYFKARHMRYKITPIWV